MIAAASFPPAPTRAPDFYDDFSGPLLDDNRWVDHYLPQWTTPERSKARYEIDAGRLRLRIDADQLDWREEDAPLRVSNLQSGSFSGPVDSPRGVHRHRNDLRVRTAVPTRMLFAPSGGRVDVTVSASRDHGCMLAVWLVGTERDTPRDSGEICVFEIDAAAIGEGAFRARTGVKAHQDDRLRTDMTEAVIAGGGADPHTWTVVWDDNSIATGCDDVIVKRVDQSIRYPLILMVDLFKIGGRSPDSSYPKSALVHEVAGWHASSSTPG